MPNLRLLLKCEDGSLRKIYWLTSRPKFVHAWCFAANQMIPELPTGISCEAHWTYPEDGAVHTSFKFYEGDHSLAAVLHAWNEITRIKSLPGCSATLSEYLRLHSGRITSFPAGHHAAPLSEFQHLPHFFSFASVSMPIKGTKVSDLPVASDIRASDLVVESESMRASFFASIQGAGFVSRFDGPAGKPQFMRTIANGFPTITVGAFTA